MSIVSFFVCLFGGFWGFFWVFFLLLLIIFASIYFAYWTVVYFTGAPNTGTSSQRQGATSGNVAGRFERLVFS